MRRFPSAKWLAAMCFGVSLLASAAIAAEEPFRPEAGKFPPLAKSASYRGELAFVDHANRRGSIRVQGPGMFFRNGPQPFAMLPYGIVRYRGAPADLRDIPLGTMLHVRAFVPPDPKSSAVPVIQKGTIEKPAENHVILLEDEVSYCQREGKIWKLKEVELQKNEGTVLASCEAKEGSDSKQTDEKMTIDAATRIWRGRECLTLSDLIADGTWPATGKKSLGGQSVYLGISWVPTPESTFNQFHISDIWLDETAMQRATQRQTEAHKALIRSYWMPGWVDHVEYGKFGRATVTATLFGGMDESLYADFKKDIPALMAAAENTLKHSAGAYGPDHMAAAGQILDVTRIDGKIPFGSSGIQIRFETDLVTEGMRPGRIIRVRPTSWPRVAVPREEYLNEGGSAHEERFPTPAIFPKY